MLVEDEDRYGRVDARERSEGLRDIFQLPIAQRVLEGGLEAAREEQRLRAGYRQELALLAAHQQPAAAAEKHSRSQPNRERHANRELHRALARSIHELRSENAGAPVLQCSSVRALGDPPGR